MSEFKPGDVVIMRSAAMTDNPHMTVRSVSEGEAGVVEVTVEWFDGTTVGTHTFLSHSLILTKPFDSEGDEPPKGNQPRRNRRRGNITAAI